MRNLLSSVIFSYDNVCATENFSRIQVALKKTANEDTLRIRFIKQFRTYQVLEQVTSLGKLKDSNLLMALNLKM